MPSPMSPNSYGLWDQAVGYQSQGCWIRWGSYLSWSGSRSRSAHLYIITRLSRLLTWLHSHTCNGYPCATGVVGFLTSLNSPGSRTLHHSTWIWCGDLQSPPSSSRSPRLAKSSRIYPDSRRSRFTHTINPVESYSGVLEQFWSVVPLAGFWENRPIAMTVNCWVTSPCIPYGS